MALDAPKKNKALSISANHLAWAHLRRLVRTGVYGNSEPSVAYKLIQDGLARLINSGELEKLEAYAKTTIETDRPLQEEGGGEETGSGG